MDRGGKEGGRREENEGGLAMNGLLNAKKGGGQRQGELKAKNFHFSLGKRK